MTHTDFVEVYDNALDGANCQTLIDRFEASGQARRGETGGGVDASLKNSWDIPLDANPGPKDQAQDGFATDRADRLHPYAPRQHAQGW